MANYDHDAAEEAIASIESGGNYGTMGPKTANGDQAYGKYQVMGANIPEWTKAATGTALTPAQYLADEDAQDTTFHHRFGSYVDKYGSPEDAASAWFTGQPRSASSGTRSDVLGTTGNSYVSKFADKYYDELGIPNPNSKARNAMAQAPDETPPALATPAGPLSSGFNWDNLGQTLMNMAPGIAQSPEHATALVAAAQAAQKAKNAGTWSTHYDERTGMATQTNSADPSQQRTFKYAAPKPDEKWGTIGYDKTTGKPIPGYQPSKEEWEAANTPEALAAKAAADAAANPQSGLTGKEFMDALTTKDAGYGKRVAAIVNGQEALPVGRAAMEGTPGGQLVKDVMQADPSYEQGNANARKLLRAQYESSSAPNSPANMIKVSGTAMHHGGLLSDNIEAFKAFNDHHDSAVPYVSWALNSVHNSQLAGQSTPEAQAYAAAIKQRENYGDEVSKFYGGGPAGEQAKKRAIENLDFAKSLPELRAIMAADMDMIHGKAATLQDAWRQGMRGSTVVPDFPVISQESQANVDRIKGRYDQTKDGSYTGPSDTKASAKPSTFKTPQGVSWSIN